MFDICLEIWCEGQETSILSPSCLHYFRDHDFIFAGLCFLSCRMRIILLMVPV